MSLKAFHIFFITISSLLSLFLIVWGIWDFRATGTVLSLGLAVVGAGGLLLLTRYLKWFRQKIKNLALAIATLSLGLFQAWSSQALACAVCYQDPNSLMTKGALAGVAFLFGIIATVLALIVVVAVSWIRRARMMASH